MMVAFRRTSLKRNIHRYIDFRDEDDGSFLSTSLSLSLFKFTSATVVAIVLMHEYTYEQIHGWQDEEGGCCKHPSHQ